MADLSGEEPNIRKLAQLAESALQGETQDTEKFLQAVADYLEALEDWRKGVESRPDPAQADKQAQAALSELNELHKKVVERAGSLKQDLVSEMGEAKKKASALKAYVDQYPQRITIAGKRKG